MWAFGKKKGEKSKEQQQGPLTYQRQYVRINRDIGIISPDIPGYKTVTRDISLGGAKIVLPKFFSIGTIIKIAIDFENHNKPLELSAEIVWIKEIEPNRKYEAGLKFIYTNPEQQQKVEKYILYILETQSNWYKTLED
ncbi:MAG: PilZ domain-containing protein [Candidatus Calescibacterium sp.]|nr:PilZ domain-containing protein [Candidatus Calescibacterium sp.]MCX7972424.1 PilZ domain-containing protein [bacterium]MDW8195685.1 PilZ domain-containing protein [Candidatus Calescibacterium sp.]